MKRWSWILPLLLSILTYLPSLSGELVWDDAIVVNKQILHFQDLQGVFFPPGKIPQWAGNYYRPVVVLTYLLDRAVFGPQATTGPHVSNVLFHMAVTLFVLMFATQCLRGLPSRRWGAVFAASLFAVHPIHTESVCWVTGRSDAVGALFMVPSVVTALYYRDHRASWALISAPVLFLLALFSKEVTLSTLFVLPVLLLLVPRANSRPAPASPASTQTGRRRRMKKKPSVPARPGPGKPQASQSDTRSFVVLGGLYLVATLIYFVFRHHAHVGYGSILDMTPGHVVDRALKATAYYVLKAVVPMPQLHFVAPGNLPGTGLSLAILFAIAIALGMAVLFLRRLTPLLFISLAWFGCTVSPSLAVAVLKISETPVAERYLYLPSIALSLLLGGIFCLALNRKRIVLASVGVAIAMVATYAAGALRRETVWQDNIRLWSDATHKAPGQGLPWTELGMAYTAKGELAEALACFRKAIHAEYDNEGRSIAYNNIGMIHLRQHRLDEAESSFDAAIGQRPQYPTPHYGLGLVAIEKAMQSDSLQKADDLAKDAAESFRTAVRLNPKYMKALWGLTRSLRIQGTIAEKTGKRKLALEKYRAALETFKQLLQIDPRFVTNHPAEAKSIEKLRRHLDALNRNKKGLDHES